MAGQDRPGEIGGDYGRGGSEKVAGESVSDQVILVLGAGGMVGSSIVRALRSKGYRNVLAPNRSELDLTVQEKTLLYFQRHRPDWVFVAAAKVGGIVANDTYRAEFLWVNLQIQNNVFQGAFESGVKKLLFLGSSCIYPKKNWGRAICEEDLLTGALEPTNEPYAIAKIAGLKLAENFKRQYGKNFISAMPTNLYGENDNYHPENSHVIPGLMVRLRQAMEKGEKTFVVWGSGRPRWEFLYVDDLADACLFLMEYPGDIPWSFVNVGTGKDIPIGELAQMIAEIMGFEGEISFDSSRPDGMMEKRLDISKMAGLGWSPKTSLRDGLEKTVGYFYRERGKRIDGQQKI